MCKNKILEKLLAIILIFTLTFANFAFTSKVYAASIAEVLFGAKNADRSVSFDAYFSVDGQTGKSIISDVNNKELFINMDLAVKNKGYLKDAKIQITGDESDLNFVVKENIAASEKIEESEKVELQEEISDSNEEVLKIEENSEEIEEEQEQEETLNELATEIISGTENVIEEPQNEKTEMSAEQEEILNALAEDVVETISEEEEEITVEELVEEEEKIEKFENNTLYLNQFSGNASLEIQLPIEYKNEEYINEEKVSSNSKIIFTGIYVNEKGEETEVSDEIVLNVSWIDEREVEIDTEATKYITYDEGVIFQTVQRIDNTSEENTLPVKETELNIEVPIIQNERPKTITVAANSTKATNGNDVGEVKFNMENWSYDIDTNILTIKVENEKKVVEINENEDELIEEDKIVEEERYYNGSGIDEFLITYTYENVESTEEPINVTSNVTAKMTTFSGAQDNNNENVVTNSKEYNYELTGSTGTIVSLSVENKTENLSKAYAYINYNKPDRYEMEFCSNELINISYKEIVNAIILNDVENLYVDKEGNSITNNDLYYKKISVSKSNFNEILGEDGFISVKNELGIEIAKITSNLNIEDEPIIISNETGMEIVRISDVPSEYGDETINVEFSEKYSRLSIETSSPIDDGNLVISKIMAMKNLSIDKATLSNLAKVVTKTAMIAIYDYVEEPVEIGTLENSTNLLDTETAISLNLDKESLSTIENNEVNIRISLNNANEKSDIYGHSEFEVVFPEDVENVEITNQGLIYEEGLVLTSVVTEGRIVRIVLDGVQEKINSGVLSNDTNIVLDANLKVNKFASSKDEIIAVNYVNNEATNYKDGGHKEIPVRFSAPTGVVAISGIKDYGENAEEVISVRQGRKEALIPVHSGELEVTEEIIVLNNNSNLVSNMSILGRVPYEGMTDLKTGEEIGTTLDVTMNSLISCSEENRAEFKIYYSENPDATKDLNDPLNEWKENVDDLEYIVSYLIVPVDENYTMEKGELLRFSYKYIVPEDLSHNEYAFGTFGVYYTNNSEIANINEISVPDLVGVTSGQGPELEMTVTSNKEEFKETEEAIITINVENTGSVVANNVQIVTDTTEDLQILNYSSSKEDVILETIKETYFDKYVTEIGVKTTLPSIAVGENVEIKITVKAKNLGEETYSTEEGFSAYKLEFKDIKILSNLTADDLGTEIEDELEMKIISGEITINEKFIGSNTIERAGNKLKFVITVENFSNKDFENLVIKKEIPKEFKIYSCNSRYEFDEKEKIAIFKFDKIESKKQKQVILEVIVNELDENINSITIDSKCTAKANSTDEYESNVNYIEIAKPVLKITQTSTTDHDYIKEGEEVNYRYSVRNEGLVDAYYVNLTEVVPDGLGVKNIKYTIDEVETNRSGLMTDNIDILTNIGPGKELVVDINAVALSLKGAEEKSVKNYAIVSANQIDPFESDAITHIIEASESSNDYDEDSNTNKKYLNNNISKTYKISGIAWFDANQDGMRGAEEELLKGITAKLINSDTGVIKGTATTDNKGEYNFAGVENGNYLVVFEYDTAKYSITTYRKEGIASNVNSDAFVTQISQNNITKTGGVTDTIKIENGSVSNIDIGLVLTDKFDLKLDKTITKVVVQTPKDTITENYNNVTLAKAEIASKHLTGSTIYVEYEIKVSNVGDIAGYAKKIIDYLPEGMTFNSGIDSNKDWYTGSDGNLYSEAFANKELKPGDSQSIKLVLTRQMTTENTGIISNQAEIYENYNSFGVKDKNSTPANKVQSENDLGKADMVIAVKTGEVFIYASVIITSFLLGCIVTFVVYNNIVISKRKWVV